MDRGACWATAYGVTKSWTELSDQQTKHLEYKTLASALNFFSPFFCKVLPILIFYGSEPSSPTTKTK